MKKADPPMVPMRCPVCKQCWADPERAGCIYNGPFDGYVEVKQQPKPPC